MARAIQDPRDAARHVTNEVRMLRRAWATQSDPLAYTAWFIHCRNLMKFFASEGDNGEVKVSAFVAGVEKEWEDGVKGMKEPENLKDYRLACNQLAAHLTWERIQPKWQAFVPSRDVTEYLLGMAAILQRVVPVERSGWFAGMI